MQLDAPSNSGGNMIDLLDFDAKPTSTPASSGNLLE
jgi:hypothetical protein